MPVSRKSTTELLEDIFKAYYSSTWLVDRVFNGNPEVITELKRLHKSLQDPAKKAELDETELYALCKIALEHSLKIQPTEHYKYLPLHTDATKGRYTFSLPGIENLFAELKPEFYGWVSLHQQGVFNYSSFYAIYQNRNYLRSASFSSDPSNFFFVFAQIIALLFKHGIITLSIFQSILRLTHQELEALHIFLFTLDEKKHLTQETFKNCFNFICQNKDIWKCENQDFYTKYEFIRTIFFLYYAEMATDSMLQWVQNLVDIELNYLHEILDGLYQRNILNKIFFPFLFSLYSHDDQNGFASQVTKRRDQRAPFQRIFHALIMQMDEKDKAEHLVIYRKLQSVAAAYVNSGIQFEFLRGRYSGDTYAGDINHLLLELSKKGLLTIFIFKAILAQPVLIDIVDNALVYFRRNKNNECLAILIDFFKVSFEFFARVKVANFSGKPYWDIWTMMGEIASTNKNLVEKALIISSHVPSFFQEIWDTQSIENWYQQLKEIKAILAKFAAYYQTYMKSLELAKGLSVQRKQKTSFFSLLPIELLAQVALESSQLRIPSLDKQLMSYFYPPSDVAEKPVAELPRAAP